MPKDSVGQQRPRSDCESAQSDLGICCLHMPGNIFSHTAVHILQEIQHDEKDEEFTIHLKESGANGILKSNIMDFELQFNHVIENDIVVLSSFGPLDKNREGMPRNH